MDAAPAGTVAGQGITDEELRLAARNHALPLEALRHPITPAGLHYLLIHYDIPDVDLAGFRLEVGGAVERPLSLTLDDLRGRERVGEPITFECAGNGRALLEPRPPRARRGAGGRGGGGGGGGGGPPPRPPRAGPGRPPGAIEVLFTALDR